MDAKSLYSQDGRAAAWTFAEGYYSLNECSWISRKVKQWVSSLLQGNPQGSAVSGQWAVLATEKDSPGTEQDSSIPLSGG